MFKWLFRSRSKNKVDSAVVDIVRYGLMGKNDVRTDRVVVPVDRATWEAKYDHMLDDGLGDVLPQVVYFRPDGSGEVWLVLRVG